MLPCFLLLFGLVGSCWAARLADADREPATRYDLAVTIAPLIDRQSGARADRGALRLTDPGTMEDVVLGLDEMLRETTLAIRDLSDGLAFLQEDVRRAARRERRMEQSRAGVHGLIAVRLVRTGANGPAGAVGAIGTTFHPLTRYSGTVGPDPTAPTFQSNVLFTVPQVSLSWSRTPDRGFGARLQIDIDADAANREPGEIAVGSADLMRVNEAFLSARGAPFGFEFRLGQFALPISREFNGSHRSLDDTITPSAIGSRLESYRGQGVEIRNNRKLIPCDVSLGFLSGLDGGDLLPGVPRRIDSLLMDDLTVGALTGTAFARTSGRPFTDRPAVTSPGRAPVPVPDPLALVLPPDPAFAAVQVGLGDINRSVYARLADRRDRGLGWDLSFISNGGNVPHVFTPGKPKITAVEFATFVQGVTYTTRRFDLLLQAYQAASKNSSTAGAIPNPVSDPTLSRGGFIRLGWLLGPSDAITVRLEQNRDEVESIGKADVSAATVCYRRVVSAHSLLQLELVAPVATVTAVPGNPNGAVSNDTDQDDMMVSANYKLDF